MNHFSCEKLIVLEMEKSGIFCPYLGLLTNRKIVGKNKKLYYIKQACFLSGPIPSAKQLGQAHCVHLPFRSQLLTLNR